MRMFKIAKKSNGYTVIIVVMNFSKNISGSKICAVRQSVLVTVRH